MSKYNCEICSFNTGNKTDYNRHNRTKKHKEKVKASNNESNMNPKRIQYESKNKFACDYCDNLYSTQSNRSKHMAKCAKKIINDTIKEKETEYIIKDKDLSIKDKEIEILKNQVAIYESLLRSSMAPQTINNFNFISNTYTDTPALKCQPSYISICEAKTMSLVELIYLYYHDNKLVIFIGDYIIKLYKKEEPKDQAMWSSDVSRLTYIIRESCNKKRNVWSYDKKGAQTKKIIIEPALNYLREKLFDYCQQNSGSIKESVLKHMITANEVIQLIDSGKLADDIVRYIAPEFYIKQIEGSEIKQIEAPKETKVPSTKQIKAPATKQSKTPIATQTKAPATKQFKTPIATQTKAPAATQTKAPAATQTKASVATQTKTQPIKQTKAPATKQTNVTNVTKASKKKQQYSETESEQESYNESEQDFMKTLRELKAEQKLQLEQESNQVKTNNASHNSNLFID